jgi:hypothetical protein
MISASAASWILLRTANRFEFAKPLPPGRSHVNCLPPDEAAPRRRQLSGNHACSTSWLSGVSEYCTTGTRKRMHMVCEACLRHVLRDAPSQSDGKLSALNVWRMNMLQRMRVMPQPHALVGRPVSCSNNSYGTTPATSRDLQLLGAFLRRTYDAKSGRHVAGRSLHTTTAAHVMHSCTLWKTCSLPGTQPFEDLTEWLRQL